MDTRRLNAVVERLCSAIVLPGTPSDRQLLDQLIEHRDQAAFTAIVRRHGPMVLGVCQRVIGNSHDADDAFQATFLVLARRAHSLCQRELVANWLYGVALRVARKARAMQNRRRLHERSIDELILPEWQPAVLCDDLHAVVDEEVGRLPAKYRLPVILCELQGRPRKEVARELALPEGTLSSRLASARRLLARRLRRRGIALSLGSLATTISSEPAFAVVPFALVESTVTAMASDIPSQNVATMAQGVIRAMSITRIKVLATAFWVLAVASFATGVLVAGADPQASKDAPIKTPKSGGAVAEEPDKWQYLLDQVDPDKYTVGKGIWRLKEGKLIGYPADHGARLRIPIVPTGNYELRARWEPKSGDSSAAFIVPHGDRMASVELMTGFGCTGLGDLNGVRPNINETKKEVAIKSGKVYGVFIRVSTNGGTVHVLAKLDDRTIIDWEGKRSELEHEFFAPPKPASLGLGVSGNVSVFHSLELRMLSGAAEPFKPETSAGSASKN